MGVGTKPGAPGRAEPGAAGIAHPTTAKPAWLGLVGLARVAEGPIEIGLSVAKTTARFTKCTL